MTNQPMGLLPNWEIIRLCEEEKMIAPFEKKKIRKIDGMDALSFGTGHYGYDITLSGEDFRILQADQEVINPKAFNESILRNTQLNHDNYGFYFVIPAHGYALGVTRELFDMPEDVTVIVLGKSTYARCGLITNMTPMEAGWRGHLTLEFFNGAPNPIRVYANEGIAQALFLRGVPCTSPYGDGKYQNQGAGVTVARL